MSDTITKEVNEVELRRSRWPTLIDFPTNVDAIRERFGSTATSGTATSSIVGAHSTYTLHIVAWDSSGLWVWSQPSFTARKWNAQHMTRQDKTAIEDWDTKTVFELEALEVVPETITYECKNFCESQGLVEVFEQCCAQTRTIFSNIQSIDCDIDYFEDDDSEEMPHVVIRIKVDADQEAVFIEYDKWLDWFVENVDDDKRDLITLLFQRV